MGQTSPPVWKMSQVLLSFFVKASLNISATSKADYFRRTIRNWPSTNAGKSTNEDALDGYRLGWATGDTDVILGVSTDTFNFTWVPDKDVVSRDRFPSFFEDFRANAEADGRGKYFMRFDNIIHRQVRNVIGAKKDVDIFLFRLETFFMKLLIGLLMALTEGLILMLPGLER